MRRSYSLLLTIIIVISIFTSVPIAVSAASTSGSLGTGVYWSYNSGTGTLHISGSGEIPFYSNQSSIPWFGYRNEITKVTVNNGITRVASIECLYNIKEIILPDSVQTIDQYAFYECSNLVYIYIPYAVTSIGGNAFYNCNSLSQVYYGGTKSNWSSISFGSDSYYLTEVTRHYNVSANDVATHYGTGNVITKPTCSSTGVRKYTCPCGHYYTETIAKTKTHNYSTSWTIDTAATCTSKGTKSHHCKNCNARTDITSIPIDKNNHNFSTSWTIDKTATCTSKGSKSRHCTRCNAKTDVTEVAPKAHIFGNWETLKKATYTSYGQEVRTCKNCGSTEYRVVPKLTCAAPKLKKVTNAVNGVKIEWNKVTGAKTYAVYRKTGSGKWEQVAKNIKTTSYTDTTAKSGTKYFYSVRAKSAAGFSKYADSLSLNYISTPKISKLSNIDYGVKITWNKVSGADTYQVYRKQKGKKWVRLCTTTDKYFIDSDIRYGKTYYYAVRACSDSAISAYKAGEIIPMHYPSSASISWCPRSNYYFDPTVNYCWGEVAGATGYHVYRAKGNGKYKKIATVKGKKNTTYEDKDPKNGRIYHYKVRAYNKTSVSAFSMPMTIDYES